MKKLGKIYTWNGKTYREKVKASSGVNSQHSMEAIYEYVTHAPRVTAMKQEDDVPFECIDDFVNTMRQSCGEGEGAFKWPSRKFGCMRALAVALHHLPVGYMVTIKNAQPIPEKLCDEHGDLHWQVSDLYHGTTATLVPRIMGQGLLPTIGACLLYTSPSPRDRTRSRMPSSA